MLNQIQESELILRPDGSVYHLAILPENVANTIITVGDPERVPEVSKYFDSIEYKQQHREIVTHTGHIGATQLTVISTGMGTDNIDIVLNELDALFNIDLEERTVKETFTPLKIVRLGTAGGLQPELGVDSLVVTENAIGMDGLMHFYRQGSEVTFHPMLQAFSAHLDINDSICRPYLYKGTPGLVDLFSDIANVGTTISCTGFYGPQGRQLRLPPAIEDFIPKMQSFDFEGIRLTNFEMETSGLYGLCNLLGHQCCSISAIIANRATGQFSNNSAKAVERMIKLALEKLSSHD